MRTVTEKPYSEADATAERRALRADSCVESWAQPKLEPLATRLADTNELEACRAMTLEMLADLHAANYPVIVTPNVQMGESFEGTEAPWVVARLEAIMVDFLVVSWNGVFLIWSWPDQSVSAAVSAAVRARAQIQEEIGEEWPGTVEAVFHFPREETRWGRQLGVDEETGEPWEIVAVGGRIDKILIQWEPHDRVGIDPLWLRWLSQASEPRWWEVGTTRKPPPKLEIPND